MPTWHSFWQARRRINQLYRCLLLLLSWIQVIITPLLAGYCGSLAALRAAMDAMHPILRESVDYVRPYLAGIATDSLKDIINTRWLDPFIEFVKGMPLQHFLIFAVFVLLVAYLLERSSHPSKWTSLLVASSVPLCFVLKAVPLQAEFQSATMATNQRRIELLASNRSELRKLAKQRGVDDKSLLEALDAKDQKNAFIDLISKREMYFQVAVPQSQVLTSSEEKERTRSEVESVLQNNFPNSNISVSVSKLLSHTLGANQNLTSFDERQIKLRKYSLSDLHQLAKQRGANDKSLDAALDAEDQRNAYMNLILERELSFFITFPLSHEQTSREDKERIRLQTEHVLRRFFPNVTIEFDGYSIGSIILAFTLWPASGINHHVFQEELWSTLADMIAEMPNLTFEASTRHQIGHLGTFPHIVIHLDGRRKAYLLLAVKVWPTAGAQIDHVYEKIRSALVVNISSSQNLTAEAPTRQQFGHVEVIIGGCVLKQSFLESLTRMALSMLLSLPLAFTIVYVLKWWVLPIILPDLLDSLLKQDATALLNSFLMTCVSALVLFLSIWLVSFIWLEFINLVLFGAKYLLTLLRFRQVAVIVDTAATLSQGGKQHKTSHKWRPAVAQFQREQLKHELNKVETHIQEQKNKFEKAQSRAKEQKEELQSALERKEAELKSFLDSEHEPRAELPVKSLYFLYASPLLKPAHIQEGKQFWQVVNWEVVNEHRPIHERNAVQQALGWSDSNHPYPQSDGPPVHTGLAISSGYTLRKVLESCEAGAVLHLSLHGAVIDGEAQLLFEDAQGRGVWMDDRRLAKLLIFAGGCDKLQVCFLSCCHGERFGHVFHRAGCRYVVCVKDSAEVLPETVKTFTKLFYGKLGKDHSVEMAFKLAKCESSNFMLIPNSDSPMESEEEEQPPLSQQRLTTPVQRKPSPLLSRFTESSQPKDHKQQTWRDLTSNMLQTENVELFGVTSILKRANTPGLPANVGILNRDFVGRQFQLCDLLGAFFQGRRCACVHGPPEIGKSSFLERLVHFASRPGRIFAHAVFVDCKGKDSPVEAAELAVKAYAAYPESRIKSAMPSFMPDDGEARQAPLEHQERRQVLSVAISIESDTEQSVLASITGMTGLLVGEFRFPTEAAVSELKHKVLEVKPNWASPVFRTDVGCEASTLDCLKDYSRLTAHDVDMGLNCLCLLERLNQLHHCGHSHDIVLLAFDGLQENNSNAAELEELLYMCPFLYVCIADRYLWKRDLLTCKVEPVKLDGLDPLSAAQLLMIRARRPFKECDFIRRDSQSSNASGGLEGGMELLQQLMCHPKLINRNGNPGRVRRLADRVSEALQSLYDVIDSDTED